MLVYAYVWSAVEIAVLNCLFLGVLDFFGLDEHMMLLLEP